MDEDRSVTIFDALQRPEVKAEVEAAIRNLITGKTPKKEIRSREVGRGKKAPYVNAYYMTRQISLITGFRWSSECLEEKTYPDKPPYRYLGARMKVTIWDRHGNQFSHTSWGEKPITEGVGYFDQWKAAYTDGIKKCLSYFGIGNDVYGAKDLQFLGEEPPEPREESLDAEMPDYFDLFTDYVTAHKIAPAQVEKILGLPMSKITNWELAYNKVREATK